MLGKWVGGGTSGLSKRRDHCVRDEDGGVVVGGEGDGEGGDDERGGAEGSPGYKLIDLKRRQVNLELNGGKLRLS
jgi:hypothetical protein